MTVTDAEGWLVSFLLHGLSTSSQKAPRFHVYFPTSSPSASPSQLKYLTTNDSVSNVWSQVQSKLIEDDLWSDHSFKERGPGKALKECIPPELIYEKWYDMISIWPRVYLNGTSINAGFEA